VAIWFATFVFGVWAPWYLIVGLAAVVGFLYPGINHKEKAAERDLDFKRNLPEALDLIIISVSAGRTFNQALRDTVPHLKDSHLKTELSSVIRTVDSGRTMKEALDNFADRAPSTSIVTFTRSLQEASELNASMEGTLRSRSDESRAELFSMIRERTAALPIKMTAVLTPTLSFALMIILLAPFVTSLMAILQ
jgi:tight adherence protein C